MMHIIKYKKILSVSYESKDTCIEFKKVNVNVNAHDAVV